MYAAPAYNVYAGNQYIMQYQAMPPQAPPEDTFVRNITDDDSRLYRKSKQLGSGTYGQVFEATKLSTGEVSMFLNLCLPNLPYIALFHGVLPPILRRPVNFKLTRKHPL